MVDQDLIADTGALLKGLNYPPQLIVVMGPPRVRAAL
jgi:hypothetical protein